MVYPSGFWKRAAKEALKNHWLTALLIALIVNLPSLLVQGIASMTGNDLISRLQDLLMSSVSANGTTVDADRIMAGMQELRNSTGIWVMQGLNAAAWLMTPCLTLGMVAWMLGRLRRQEDAGVTAVFSRFGLFWKGIGLRLYTAWRIFLFMLPGVALSILSLLPLWLSDRNSSVSVLSAANTMMGMQSLAMIAMMALGIIAALRYALGDMHLADHPEWGPVRAAKESRNVTQGRKGQLFSLYISFIPWYLLETVVSGLCLDLFGGVPALMVQMLGSLAITVYLNASVCAFYLGCLPGEVLNKSEESSEET